VDKNVFREENNRVARKGAKPASAEPLLLVITKASLTTQSLYRRRASRRRRGS